MDMLVVLARVLMEVAFGVKGHVILMMMMMMMMMAGDGHAGGAGRGVGGGGLRGGGENAGAGGLHLCCRLPPLASAPRLQQ